MYFRKIFYLILLIGLCFCQEKKNGQQISFTELDPELSKVDFSNIIIENDTLNYFEFPYLYLGGGVSVGDINNDDLPDIYFTGNTVSNKLYLNKGNLQFEDITVSAGVGGDDRWYTGTTMVDVNNDGFLDIYVGVSEIFGKSSNQLFINNGDNTFSEEAESYGIADMSTTIQSTFLDYDNDGWLDLFVANYPLVLVSMGNEYYYQKMLTNKYEDSGHLYKNNGNGTFTDVTTKAGVRNFGLTLGLVSSDFNNDGFTDLYLSNDFNVPDYLYQNNGDGTFTEISKSSLKHTSMFGMGIDASDFNNDGLFDLLQVDMTAEDHKRSKTNMASMSPQSFFQAVDLGLNYQYMQNSLQLNNGLNQNKIPVFSDISRFAGMATTDWSWGALFADFDNDGWEDVFISNGVKRDVNNNDVQERYRMEHMFGKKRKKDYTLMPSTPVSNYAFKNNGDHSFSKVTQEWGLDKKGFSNGFAYADLDNDGDLDLVINNMNEKASIYINPAESSSNNYLKIKLIGKKQNPFAIGAKVTLKSEAFEQNKLLTLTKGYQSSVEPILHFGIGKQEKIKTIEVTWPDGTSQTLNKVTANQTLKIKYNKSESQSVTKKNTKVRFEDVTKQSGIDFTHTEDNYKDFAFEPLLPHRNSKLGSALTVGDINNDGMEDFFVGNAKDATAAMYIQDSLGKFRRLEGPWESDSIYEDTGALLFDADNDSDLDLYVVNGGNHITHPEKYYQDRLYLNTEKGFVKTTTSLPEITSSGQQITSGDYDGDGDLDLFVGGRIIPGKYPFPAESIILRNDGGKDAKLRFTNVTQEIAPQLSEAGLVTSALWDDFNMDGKLDLIITGEWMPIRFFKNTGKDFKEVTNDLKIGESSIGWWYGLQKADLDGDGDMDYLAGNLGLNYKYKASIDTPFEIYTNDFDENGTTDIVLSYRKDGTKLPLRGRECSSQQVPVIKARFKTFESFADASLQDIYGQQMLKKSLHYSANTFAHYWLENKGNDTFKMQKLPNQSQFSSINAFEIFDYDGDEFPDILMAGNLYHSEIETPRNDASHSLILKGNAQGNLTIVSSTESGLIVDGEVKNIQSIKVGSKNSKMFLFAINDSKIKLFRYKN